MVSKYMKEKQTEPLVILRLKRKMEDKDQAKDRTDGLRKGTRIGENVFIVTVRVAFQEKRH
jgi:hypothetical protein